MFAIFPEILHAAQNRDLEALACLIRKYFAGSQAFAPRLRIASLFDAMGIQISQEQAPYFARLQAIDHRGQYRIAVSLSVRVVELQEANYTLAYLLAYFLLEYMPLMARAELSAEAHQLESSLLSRLARQRGPSNIGTVSAAEELAMALLMPRGMVKKASETLRSPESCAAFFNVPLYLLELRLDKISGQSRRVSAQDAKVQPQVETAEAATGRTTKPVKAAPGPGVANGRARSSGALPSPQEKSSSIARMQQSAVSRSYKREEQRTSSPSMPTEPEESGSKGGGLKRLRALAKKIDGSVET